MIDHAVPSSSWATVEATLSAQLARGDAVAENVPPILRHLFTTGGVQALDEEILVRVRAMLGDLSVELLDLLVGETDRIHSHSAQVEVLGGALLDNPELLTHLHALALEWQLTERLQAGQLIDPVMPPLVRNFCLHGSLQRQASAFIASQAQWCQARRQMKLRLSELPPQLLNVALYTLQMLAGAEPHLIDRANAVEAEVRAVYRADATRDAVVMALFQQLPEQRSALSIADGGVAMFLTAVSVLTSTQKDAVVLSTQETQAIRLALSLRSLGLDAREIGRQLDLLHPNFVSSSDLDNVPERAAQAMLVRWSEGRR